MKIDALNNALPPAATTGKAKAAAAKAPEKPAASDDDVKLSAASSTLTASAGDSASAARIQEIRQAIAEGRFQINAGAIADGLIESARELARHKGSA